MASKTPPPDSAALMKQIDAMCEVLDLLHRERLLSDEQQDTCEMALALANAYAVGLNAGRGTAV